MALALACGGGGGGPSNSLDAEGDSVQIGTASQKIMVDIADIGLSERSKAIDFDQVSTVTATFTTSTGNVSKTLTHESGTQYSTDAENLEIGTELTMDLEVTLSDGTTYVGSAQLTIPASGESETIQVVLQPGEIVIDAVLAIDIDGIDFVSTGTYQISAQVNVQYDSQYDVNYTWSIDGQEQSANADAISFWATTDSEITVAVSYADAPEIADTYTKVFAISLVSGDVTVNQIEPEDTMHQSGDQKVLFAHLQATTDQEYIRFSDLAFSFDTYNESTTGATLASHIQGAFHDNLVLEMEYNNDGNRVVIQFDQLDVVDAGGNIEAIIFENLAQSDSQGVYVNDGDQIDIFLYGDIVAETASSGDSTVFYYIFDKSLSRFRDDKFLTLTESDISFSDLATIMYLGELGDAIFTSSANISGNTVIAGGTYSFLDIDLESTGQNKTITRLPIRIDGVFGTDGANRSVQEVFLLDESGNIITFDNGSPAVLSGISVSSSNVESGYVVFTDISITDTAEEVERITVAANLRAIGDDSNETTEPWSKLSFSIEDEEESMIVKGVDNTILEVNLTEGAANPVYVKATDLQITTHAQSPDTISNGSDVECMRFTLTVPENESDSSIMIKRLSMVIEEDGFQVSNITLRDASDPSASLVQAQLLRSSDSVYQFVFDTPYEVSNGTSETLFVTLDIDNFDLDGESLTVQLLVHGSVDANINTDDLDNTSYDFAVQGKAGIIYTEDEAGDTKRWILDQSDLPAQVLTGF